MDTPSFFYEIEPVPPLPDYLCSLYNRIGCLPDLSQHFLVFWSLYLCAVEHVFCLLVTQLPLLYSCLSGGGEIVVNHKLIWCTEFFQYPLLLILITSPTACLVLIFAGVQLFSQRLEVLPHLDFRPAAWRYGCVNHSSFVWLDAPCNFFGAVLWLTNISKNLISVPQST